MNVIVSTSEQPYTQFMAEAMNTFEDYNIKGIAIVALTDGDTLTGYWNMNLDDRAKVKTEVEFDCIDEFMKRNIDRYIDYESEDGEE